MLTKNQTSTIMDHPFFVHLAGVIDVGYSKNWITPTLCIGDLTSSYEPFNVVVNCNYPYNRIPHGKTGRREEHMHSTTCTLYLVGLCDHDTDINTLEGCIMYLIPRLRKKYEENNKYTFLFHCYAGKSRSVALALAFMVEVLGMKYDEALQVIKEKRPIIEPRPLFIETLRNKYMTCKE